MLGSLPASRRGLSMAMAQASKAPRAYFYFVDTHGRLYLHDTTPRTIATCLKDSKFLDFFWKRLQLNTNELVSSSAFPYVSPCGSEMNFVQCADTPIVFHTLHASRHLLYAGSLQHPFQPSTMFSVNGRLYHPAPSIGTCNHALLSNSLTLQLMSYAVATEKGIVMNIPTHDPVIIEEKG